MPVIVTDSGFQSDDWVGDYCKPCDPGSNPQALDLSSDIDPDTVLLHSNLQMIRVNIHNFADGRGFTIARQLRLRGFKGRLRARGNLISDQYTMVRRSGFDEIEITDELAKRQTESEWLFRSKWKENDYQSLLRG